MEWCRGGEVVRAHGLTGNGGTPTVLKMSTWGFHRKRKAARKDAGIPTSNASDLEM